MRQAIYRLAEGVDAAMDIQTCKGRASRLVLSVIVLGLVPNSVIAKSEGSFAAAPEVVRQIVNCQTLSDSVQRLECYDKTVAALQIATDRREIVIADKADVKEARRGLFGFKLPSLKIFGGPKDDDEIREITSTIKGVRTTGSGQWRIILQDGAIWEQISTDVLAFDPKPGNPIKIRQAAVGSFKATVDGQPAVRVRRVE
ncbi:hypothetical protein NSDW_35360 [Novosphingobium olei]|nr:hypothetical protein NSDW_35360 [Novosphingobium olei]